jgi:hypothetical protein
MGNLTFLINKLVTYITEKVSNNSFALTQSSINSEARRKGVGCLCHVKSTKRCMEDCRIGRE